VGHQRVQAGAEHRRHDFLELVTTAPVAVNVVYTATDPSGRTL